MNAVNVLVIEPDAVTRTTLRDLLSAAHATPFWADSLAAAWDILTNETIKAVMIPVRRSNPEGLNWLRDIVTKNSDVKVLAYTDCGSVRDAVAVMQNGAVDYLTLPIDVGMLTAALDRVPEVRSTVTVEHTPAVISGIQMVAEDVRSVEILNLARRVAWTETSILLSGESGTGKEVLARFIHQNSPRANGPFIAINCAAIPEQMLEALLFGYEKGAFTGAHQMHIGKFEQAQGGTILLDEISEIDFTLQAKLLRVLQEREIERLCGRKSITLDVRILAATNRSLREEVAAGRFREDLFYRLNVFPLHIPALRDRPRDILLLAQTFIDRHVPNGNRPELTESARQKLLEHKWPGNARELDNVVQRALILRSGEAITAESIQFETDTNSTQTVAANGGASALHDGVRLHEHRLILDTLNASHGSRKMTAEILGISPRTLRYKIAKMRESGVSVPGGL